MFIFSSLLQGPPASVSWLRVLLRGAKSIRRQRFGLKKLDSRISFLAAGGPKSEFEVRTQVYTHLPTSLLIEWLLVGKPQGMNLIFNR